MLQRIQSLYLFFTGLLAGGMFLFYDGWKTLNKQTIQLESLIAYLELFVENIGIAFFLVLFLAFLSLFSFKNRKRQIGINRINILINLILFGLLTYHLLKISGEAFASMKGVERFLPLVSIALLLLANRAIQKDEDLVKSVDRLR
ncbi:MAG TPA: DUF4293 family protein [Lutibacter sp.]|nr:DUF4293 family protein [Lutibacter sp.]